MNPAPISLPQKWHPQTLEEDVVCLALVDPADVAATAQVTCYRELLEPHERDRHDSFRFQRNRHEYLITRALVRTELSQYASISPEALRFVTNGHGRPELAQPEGAWLRFNLSNTDGLVACAIVRGRDVGVDVESITSLRGDFFTVADHFFSAEEARELHALPASHQRRRFLEYWTLKEAYLKARGIGLAVSLASFTFLIGDDGPIRVEFDAELGDDERAWQFWLLRPTPLHQLAVALRCDDGRHAELRSRWVTTV